MTWRRLHVLVSALPAEALFRAELRLAQERTERITPDKIRSRQAEWEARNAAQRAKEPANG